MPSPSFDDAIAANRKAWDASAPLHRGDPSWDRLTDNFANNPDFSWFDPPMQAALLAIGLGGKTVAQLCCNNGRETVSLINLGARAAIGFDQSEAFLDQARELARIAGRACQFVAGDVHAIDAQYDGRFDLVVITIGVLGWMPDLARFMAVPARLLRPGGRILIHEEHPIANLFEPKQEPPLLVRHSYFRDTPFVGENAIVYGDGPAPPVGAHYWYVHPLSRVIESLIGAGLAIERFQEFPDNISKTTDDPLAAGRLLPLSYLLQARRGI
ncbi:class I SAM-dependent methyltransferase [Methylobacterium pseudosasicola]|uniref:Methyltransferase domain-containing protein n=1 Tax=Methylobacterium pseudosasicola TaxID=582667 RepID=A0A1I4F2Q8_9HYPH|nr:class I SAM-dependent methyltransferase [Methylobacterium pseudosasicola]SFL11849.1 Methyltransferase domain-containing protein [Methylobacterium pseudosasicola]